MSPQITELEPHWDDVKDANTDNVINRADFVKHLDAKGKQNGKIKNQDFIDNINLNRTEKTDTVNEDLEGVMEANFKIDKKCDLLEEKLQGFEVEDGILDFLKTGTKPIWWMSIIGIFLLGSIQFFLGVAIAVFSLNSASFFGIGLITEGISDMITAIRSGLIKRNFSWKSWSVQKVISFSITMALVGIVALNDALKMINYWMHGTIIIDNDTQSVLEGWNLATKLIYLELAKRLGLQIVDEMIDYGVDLVMLPKMREEIATSIRRPIQNALSKNEHFRKVLMMDVENENSDNEHVIKNIIKKFLTPTSNDFKHATISGFAKGISQHRINGMEKISKYVDAASNMKKISSNLTTTIEHLETTVEKMADRTSKKSKSTVSKKTIKNQKTGLISWASIYMPSFVIVTAILMVVATLGFNTISLNRMTSSMDSSLQNQIEDYRAERRIEFSQNDDSGERLYHNWDPVAMATALELVDDLANDGEAGLVHMGAISDTINRPIKILDEQGRVTRSIGDRTGGEPIEVQYHPPSIANPQGHWTLADGKEPDIVGGYNDCLFNVIAHQTGISPRRLRFETVFRMFDDLPSLAKQMVDIDHLKAHKVASLQSGGAKYNGQSANDASYVMDISQGRRSAASGAPGHPRAHVSNANQRRYPGQIDCVENYSYSGVFGKSGFLSKQDEDYYVHYALRSQAAQDAMRRLNNGSQKEVITVPMRLNAGQWKSGGLSSMFQARGVKLVLEHHAGQQRNPNAEVFVRSVYPTN